MATKEVLYEKEGNLAIITLNRPEKMNAHTEDMLVAITEALEDAGRDAKVRSLILTGAGDRAFSAGPDVGAMASREIGGGEPSPRVVGQLPSTALHAVLIYNFAKPTFAAVNGVAAGGGLALALKCDFRIASDKARFVSSWVHRGISNDGGSSWFLTRMLGESRALELMLSGDIIDAHEALRVGLVNRVVPHEKLMEATKEWAGRIAKGPPIAQALIKRLVRRASMQSQSLEMQLDLELYCASQASQTEDRKEGLRSFLERREPQFKGR